MRLAVGICSARDWKPHFGVSLAGLIAYVTVNGINGEKPELFDLIIRTQTSNLCRGRHSVVKECVERGFSHLLSLDDDMTFPCDMLDILVGHDKDVVGVQYSHKSLESKGMALGLDKQHVTGSGLVEVLRIGGGIMLLDMEFAKKAGPPWFEMRWIPEKENTGGEDYYFCDRLVSAGARLWCDMDLQIGHVGDFEFRMPKDQS